MSAATFRRLALRFDGAVEGAHGGHADFRSPKGKVIASLGYPSKEWGVVKLTPEQQQMLVGAEPKVFEPVNGTWGLRGNTRVRLSAADTATLRSALGIAFANVTAPSPRVARTGGRGNSR
jgi:hypothetical protein